MAKTETVERCVEALIEKFDLLCGSIIQVTRDPTIEANHVQYAQAKGALQEAFIKLLMLIDYID